MDEKESKSYLDDLIKADFKLVDTEISLACTMMVLMLLAMMALYVSILAIPLLVAAIYFIYKGYRKLFYDSVFGPACGLYRALPVPNSHRVLSKIFVAAFCELIPAVVLMVIFGFFSGAMGYGLMGSIDNLIRLFGLDINITGESAIHAACLLSVDLLNLIFNQLAFGSVVFLAVTVYQLQPQEKHTLLRKILVIAAGLLGIQMLDAVEWIFDVLEVNMPLLEASADLLLQVVVLTLTFRLTVGLMEKHYQKG